MFSYDKEYASTYFKASFSFFFKFLLIHILAVLLIIVVFYVPAFVILGLEKGLDILFNPFVLIVKIISLTILINGIALWGVRKRSYKNKKTDRVFGIAYRNSSSSKISEFRIVATLSLSLFWKSAVVAVLLEILIVAFGSVIGNPGLSDDLGDLPQWIPVMVLGWLWLTLFSKKKGAYVEFYELDADTNDRYQLK